jgi:hypothetical protein
MHFFVVLVSAIFHWRGRASVDGPRQRWSRGKRASSTGVFSRTGNRLSVFREACFSFGCGKFVLDRVVSGPQPLEQIAAFDPGRGLPGVPIACCQSW